MDAGSQHDLMAWAAHNLPFCALATSKSPPNRPLLTRLTEQGIVGILAAGIGIFVNDKIQDSKLDTVSNQITNVATRLDSASLNLDAKIQALDAKIFQIQRDQAKR